MRASDIHHDSSRAGAPFLCTSVSDFHVTAHIVTHLLSASVTWHLHKGMNASLEIILWRISGTKLAVTFLSHHSGHCTSTLKKQNKTMVICISVPLGEKPIIITRSQRSETNFRLVCFYFLFSAKLFNCFTYLRKDFFLLPSEILTRWMKRTMLQTCSWP